MRKIIIFILFLFAGSLNLNALIYNSELTKTLTAKPGDVTTVKLTMTNNKETPEEVQLSQVDYKYNYKGENFFEEPNTLEMSNANWIELQNSSFKVEPGETKEIYYSVRVPNDPRLQGSYSSAILIEPNDPVTTLQAEDQVAIQVKVRYAHQIIINVGQLKPSLKLLDSNLTQSEQGRSIYIDIENNGNTHLYPKPTLKLYDNKGKVATTLNALPQNILPGSSVRYFLPLEAMTEGEYNGLLLLDVGNGKLFAERLSLSIH